MRQQLLRQRIFVTVAVASPSPLEHLMDSEVPTVERLGRRLGM
jgi:hypothetical protein